MFSVVVCFQSPAGSKAGISITMKCLSWQSWESNPGSGLEYPFVQVITFVFAGILRSFHKSYISYKLHTITNGKIHFFPRIICRVAAPYCSLVMKFGHHSYFWSLQLLNSLVVSLSRPPGMLIVLLLGCRSKVVFING